ncbi:family 43 glycosylhydrolase [Streptomyces sp. NPDC006475]|uniref:family 43 glycosylhydrolase n=1 Tax=Streptomyces sp. NPDC006475 TaxID=3155719 RepID=UPI0033BB1886
MSRNPRARRFTILTGAVALGLTGGLTQPVQAAEPPSYIANDTVWRTIDGKEILAQGGNVFKHQGVYYWAGSELTSGKPKAVNLYSSTDLENWQFKKAIVKQSGTDGPLSAELADNVWLGRPQLNYNPATNNFVLNFEVNPGGRNQLMFATSPTVDGTYTLTSQTPVNVNGNTMGDHSVFVEGNDAYLVYVGDLGVSTNRTVTVRKLNAEWTGVAPGEALFDQWDSGKEAPGMVKANGKYYLFASEKRWWDATATHYRVSDTIAGLASSAPWAKVTHRPARGASDDSFGTQFAQIIPVVSSDGGTTSYLFNGDRYSQFFKGITDNAPGGIGRNAWYKLTFDGTTPLLHGWTDVDVNAAAGTITGNRVANGRFDQDDPSVGVPLWDLSGAQGAASTQNAAVGDGRRQLLVNDDVAFTSWVDQEVSLPNGRYELSFDYRSSATMNNLHFEVKGHGGQTAKLPLNKNQNAWATQKYTFEVTSGKANIGLWADGQANAWTNLDNVAIWPAG